MKSTEHKQFRCTFPGCDKVFNRRDYLERHATNHLAVKPYVCHLCNRHFSRKDLYDNHLTTKRHARVVAEYERAKLEKHLGQAAASQVGGDANAQLASKETQPEVPSISPTEMNHSHSHSFDAHALPGLPMYASPPVRQPAHLSGPGPGTGTCSDPAVGYHTHGLMSNEQLTSALNDEQPAQYHQDPTYRYYNDNLNMEVNDNSLSAPGFGDSQMDMGMSWASNSYPGNKLHRFSHENDQHLRTESLASSRFSACGVSLGLGSSTSSSSVSRSEISSSDDYSIDLDGQNVTASVNERIRRDMIQTPYLFTDLRENPPKGLVTSNIELSRENGFATHMGLNTIEQCRVLEDSSGGPPLNPDHGFVVVKDEGPKEARSTAEAVAAVTDKRYAWFFDDNFTTSKAKLGYDRCYSESVEVYQARSNEFASNDPSGVQYTDTEKSPGLSIVNPLTGIHNAAGSGSKRSGSFSVPNATNKLNVDGGNDILANQISIMRPLFPERAAKLLSILHISSPELNFNATDQWMQAAWIGADAVKHIVHPATFDPNNTHLALLAVLALIGMSLSEDNQVSNMARRAYAPVFLYAYDCLVQLPSNISPGRLDVSTVNKFQAFALLLRYERLILTGDGLRSNFTRNLPGKYVTDLFIGKALAAVPHVGDFSTPKKQQPIWATAGSEGYMFHQGADPEAQWREWTLIEATKRTVHFALYCDGIVTLSTAKPNPVSIFNMDIQMICPDPLWQARMASEFFYIAGPSGIITNVPYLGLLKSLIRFPRAAQSEDLVDKSHELPQIRAPWSVFALKSIAHGLIMIVGKLSGLIPHGDEMLKAVMQSRTDPKQSGNIFSKFDRQLQARLYRGLDVWYHYFSAAYGDVTDQIFRLSGTMKNNLNDDFDQPTNEGGKEIPQYALIIVLCHYSSFIFVHEDLPIVLQVTANLKSWLETAKSKSLQMLLDYLYMPLYTNWIRTDEAKGMVSASSLYLAWSHAMTGSFHTGNHMFLSAMIYISAIVMWLYDFARNDIIQTDAMMGIKETPIPETVKLNLENFQFMDDATDYMRAVYDHVSGQGPPPQKRAVNSVLLLAACLLHRRKSTKQLVEMLIQLLTVMDSDHTTQELVEVVKKATQAYEDRIEKRRDPTGGASTTSDIKKEVVDNDMATVGSNSDSISSSDGDSETGNVSDIEESIGFQTMV